MIEYDVERLGDLQALRVISNQKAQDGWTLHSFQNAGYGDGWDIVAVYQREVTTSVLQGTLKPRDPKMVEYP